MTLINQLLLLICLNSLMASAMDPLEINTLPKSFIDKITKLQQQSPNEAIIKDLRSYVQKNSGAQKYIDYLLIDLPRQKEPNIKFAQLLLGIGASPDAKDPGNVITAENPGATAINNAAYSGLLDFVKLLVRYKANLETRDPWNGFTPLMSAASNGHDNVVMFLLQAGANVNAEVAEKNNGVKTALQIASYYGYSKIVRALIAAGANRDKSDECGETALMKAEQRTFASCRPANSYDKIIRYINNKK